MKTGFLKLLMALTLSLVSLVASAQMKYVAATFDSGESEPAGVDTKLQSSGLLKDDVAIPGTARSGKMQPVSASVEAPSASASAAAPSASSTAPARSAEQPSFDGQAQWKIQNGERLSDVFTRWARTVGWQTTWEPSDLVALADLELDDTFTGAITKVVDALNRGGADIQAKFYASNRMLRIMARK